MDPLRRVRPGEQLQFNADTTNLMLDAARRTKNSRIQQSPNDPPQRDSAQVLIQASATLARFAPFALGAVVTTPATDSQFQRLPVFASATLVADSPFGVMVEPAASGCLGRGLLMGLVPAQVSIISASPAHQFVHINAGLAMESAVTGYARIIWAAGTSGSQWCLLQVPGGSAAAITPQVQLRSTGVNVPAQGKAYKCAGPEATATFATLSTGPLFAIDTSIPDGSPFVIALANGTGANAVAAVASGIVPAYVTMSATAATDQYCSFVSGVLTSSPNGHARMIWQAGSSGANVLCLLLLAPGGNAIVDWRLNKATHTFEVCKMSAPTTWVAISDANGGTLDPGVTP